MADSLWIIEERVPGLADDELCCLKSLSFLIVSLRLLTTLVAFLFCTHSILFILLINLKSTADVI